MKGSLVGQAYVISSCEALYGGVFVVMDKLGKLVYNDMPELLYMYKGLVGTPPLQMVDDILGVQECSSKSRKLNSVINTFVSLEKMKLSSTKCHNIHIGKSDVNCHKLKIHENLMLNSKQETYLGDLIGHIY